MQTIVNIKGTHCPSCKALIEDICQDVLEIESCEVDYNTGRTVINHEKDFDWHKLKSEIENSGDYSVAIPNN